MHGQQRRNQVQSKKNGGQKTEAEENQGVDMIEKMGKRKIKARND
jgi:hypothetical protein